ncbi:hypothetical protein AGLY_016940 [Aphis glycines]|uniref:Double jelly roll-like domain-containing protein n=1 Tax=Aphis glycines TaxID=307491 RepID=A0A6G0SYD3_APHGL|nr:hypothetical protein AGLY_016940 [Aphis glycines]
MNDVYLDVTARYTDDCRITQIEYHFFLPYFTSALSNNNEVRIALHNTESYTLPCESSIYIEGTKTKPAEITDDILFIINGLAFLFSEMKHEINSIQIQKLANPGITTTLKKYCSYNKSNITSHHNAAWDNDNGCINLKDWFGFCEDYKHAPKLKDVKINITKIMWRIPIVKVSDKEKIKLLKVVNNQEPLICVFRPWELYEYPFLPQNTSHSWKVYLNAEVFPYDDFQCDFTKNKIGTLYHAYTEFRKSYYGHDNVAPLLSRSDFKNLSPILIVNMIRQNDNVKTPTVDLRIKIEIDTPFPVSTSVYCLILHDQIIIYICSCMRASYGV